MKLQTIIKTAAALCVAAGTAMLHAQMAQDPLLSRTAPVEPNIVFMFDDSSSMPATAIYQFGGSPGVYGLTGPNDDVGSSAPDSYHDRSPDVNLIYYDPRVTYSRRINADGTFQAAGSVSGISSFNVYFYKPTDTTNYSVSSVTVNNKGANYPASGVTASFTAPPSGGTQATATVQTTSTPNVASVTVNTGGHDYNTTPTVTFSAPPAGGTTALGTVLTTSSLKVSGVTVGTAVGNRGVDYPPGTTITSSAPPAGGSQATGTVVLSATNKVGDTTPTNLGTGYSSAPTVSFAAPPTPGVRATGTAVLSTTYRVATVSIPAGGGGSGYPASGVTAAFSGTLFPGGTPAAATVTTAPSQKVTDVDVLTPGVGYPASVTATFSAAPSGGTTATATATTVLTYKLSSLTIASGGSYSGSLSSPKITFSAPQLPGGVQATGTISRNTGSNRAVNSVSVTNAGSGYTSPPTIVSITGLGTVNTAANITVNSATNGYAITSINMTNQGAGYTTTPTLTVSGSGSGFTKTVNMDGSYKVSSISLTNSGSGYTSAPTVSLNSPTGSGATVTMTTSSTQSVTDINITNSGSGYSSVPAITFSGGGGSGAAFTANLLATNWITGITITDPGGGYTSTPTYTLGSFSPGTGAVLTPTTSSSRGISAITITNSGSGYSSLPTLTLGNVGSGAGATYTINGGTTTVISGITVTASGGGYLNPPTMTLANTTPGSGATFTVNTGTTIVAAVNGKWPGTGPSPTSSSSYFDPYKPDAGSPLAAGATVVNYPRTVSSSQTTYPKWRNRTDCTSTANVCTWTEERQNYANWKTYHSTRLELAKTGIGLAFQPLNPTFRLGWGTINTLANSSTLDKGVRLYNGTTQSDFLTWVYTRAGNVAGTPNRTALDKVGQYYKRADSAGPWASSPTGSAALTASGTDSTHATCRRSYAMLMTDGYYNDSFTLTDVDTLAATATTSPVTYSYTPIGPYSDSTGGTRINNTFADVAMKYWLTDLRTDLANNVKAVQGDDAYWQHVNFYAIGLGLNGTLDATSSSVLQGLTGNALTSPARTTSWPTPVTNDPKAIDDMWHATINGHGKMLNAKTASELNSAITQMMSDISGKESSQAGVAVSSPSLTKDTKKYTPTYIPVTWNGNITAYNLDAATANQISVAWQVETETGTDPVTGVKTYTSLIPSAASRNIYVGNGNTSGTRAVPFTYSALSSASLTSIMNGTVNSDLIDYLRGDPTNEDTSDSSASSSAIFRERRTRLGDIVNSTPVFVKDSVDLAYDTLPSGTPGQSTYRAFVAQKSARTEGVLFVGANDGMLHAFRDGTYDPITSAPIDPGGVEVFAYVPWAILPTINQLADKTYVHRYYVDGPNTETDGWLSSASPNRWANIVLGSTGAGAGVASSTGVSPRSAVFAIDTTSLTTSVTGMNASNVLWEVSSAKTGFSELGYVLTDIQAGPTIGGTWVAVFGNGYESKSCQARMFVVNLETGALIKEFNTSSGSCASSSTKNGLGGVRLVRNDKQQILGVYAGDLLGNVWKFNMNNASTSSWSVDLGGQPLYAAGASQPITAAPSILTLPMRGTTNPTPGFMVVFGTGKFFELTDLTNTTTQSIYGIWDPLAFGAGTIPAGTSLNSRTLLQGQSITGTVAGTDGNSYFNASSIAIDYVGTTTPTVVAPRRGWWLDFPNTGQRMVYPIDVLANRFVLIDTISPTNVSLDPCSNTTGGTGYLYVLDALNGGSPSEAVFDTNGDGNVDTGDLATAGIASYADGRNVALLVAQNTLSTTYADVSAAAGATFIKISCNLTNDCPVTPSAGKLKSRQWRQLFLR